MTGQRPVLTLVELIHTALLKKLKILGLLNEGMCEMFRYSQYRIDGFINIDIATQY